MLQSWCWSWEERLPGLADSSGDVSDSSPTLVSGVNSCLPFLSPSLWDPVIWKWEGELSWLCSKAPHTAAHGLEHGLPNAAEAPCGSTQAICLCQPCC